MLRRGSLDMEWVCTIALSHLVGETIPSSLAILSTPSPNRQVVRLGSVIVIMSSDSRIPLTMNGLS